MRRTMYRVGKQYYVILVSFPDVLRRTPIFPTGHETSVAGARPGNETKAATASITTPPTCTSKDAHTFVGLAKPESYRVGV